VDPEEVRYRLMKLIDEHPQMTQREASAVLGVSLGKVNYCLRALIEKGHIKFHNFRMNPEKNQYTYLLTPSGAEAKARAPVQFLRRKMDEYEQLKQQIDALNAELATIERLQNSSN